MKDKKNMDNEHIQYIGKKSLQENERKMKGEIMIYFW